MKIQDEDLKIFEGALFFFSLFGWGFTTILLCYIDRVSEFFNKPPESTIVWTAFGGIIVFFIWGILLLNNILITKGILYLLNPRKSSYPEPYHEEE